MSSGRCLPRVLTVGKGKNKNCGSKFIRESRAGREEVVQGTQAQPGRAGRKEKHFWPSANRGSPGRGHEPSGEGGQLSWCRVGRGHQPQAGRLVSPPQPARFRALSPCILYLWFFGIFQMRQVAFLPRLLYLQLKLNPHWAWGQTKQPTVKENSTQMKEPTCVSTWLFIIKLKQSL